jgi:hypothetical protein
MFQRYNDRMRMLYAAVVVVVSAAMLAQSAPASCPADLPVDDIIAEILKQQSKKKHRNSNPLPDSICIGTWCLGPPRTPPTIPEPTPHAETPSGQNTSSSSGSSSKSPKSSPTNSKDECDQRMGQALEAAHNVDVGDYYFEQKNYNAALLRYKDALEAIPGGAEAHWLPEMV